MLRHTTLCATVVLIMAMGSTHAQGRGGVCGGLSGNAFGLCNAYCEAQSCYTAENKDSRSCTQLRSNFERLTGMNDMPCDLPVAPTGSQLGLCPCNFDPSFWPNETQILPSSSLPICSGPGDLRTCITCTISSPPADLNTYLGVLANRFVGGFGVEEDSLFFFTTDPSSPVGATCVSDVSFNSEPSIVTRGGPLSSEQLSACRFDIGELKKEYVDMCNIR